MNENHPPKKESFSPASDKLKGEKSPRAHYITPLAPATSGSVLANDIYVNTAALLTLKPCALLNLPERSRHHSTWHPPNTKARRASASARAAGAVLHAAVFQNSTKQTQTGL